MFFRFEFGLFLSLIESLLPNSLFAGKRSKSLVERRSAVHLDQINYILSLPNNERFASYLLDYEETYTSFTVDPEDRSESGKQATTSGQLREYQKIQKRKGKAKQGNSRTQAATVVVESRGPAEASTDITVARAPPMDKLQRKKAAPVARGGKKKTTVPTAPVRQATPEEIPANVPTAIPKPIFQIEDTDDDFDALLESPQAKKRKRTISDTTEPSTGSVEGKASNEGRGSAEQLSAPSGDEWCPPLEFEGKRIKSSDSLFHGSPSKAMAASKALLLPPDMERHKNRSVREVTLMAAKQAAQVTLTRTNANCLALIIYSYHKIIAEHFVDLPANPGADSAGY